MRCLLLPTSKRASVLRNALRSRYVESPKHGAASTIDRSRAAADAATTSSRRLGARARAARARGARRARSMLALPVAPRARARRRRAVRPDHDGRRRHGDGAGGDRPQLGGFKPMTTVQLQTSFLRPIAGDAGEATRHRARAAPGQDPGVRRDRGRRRRRPAGRARDHHLRAAVNVDAVRTLPALDYRTAFELAPIGLVLSRQRLMVDCNQQLLEMFGAAARRSWSAARSRCSTRRTTSSSAPASASSPASTRSGCYADERVMKRCRPRRRAVLVPRHRPRARSEASRTRPASGASRTCRRGARSKLDLTPREREIAALLIEGLTSKLIGKRLDDQPAHRRRLPRAADAQVRRRDDAGAGAQAVDGLKACRLPSADRQAAWDALLADDAALADGVAAICCAAWPRRGARAGATPAARCRCMRRRRPRAQAVPADEGDHASVEARVLAALNGALPVPTPRAAREPALHDGWHYLLMSQLRGRRLVDAWPQLRPSTATASPTRWASAVAALHAVDATPLADLPPRWDDFIAAQRASAVERQRARRLDRALDRAVDDFLDRWMPPPDTAPLAAAHRADARAPARRPRRLATERPVRLRAGDGRRAGVRVRVGRPVRRLRRRPLPAAHAAGLRLRAARDLDAALQCRFMVWAILHRYSNLRWYLERMPAQGETTLEELAARWWRWVSRVSSAASIDRRLVGRSRPRNVRVPDEAHLFDRPPTAQPRSAESPACRPPSTPPARPRAPGRPAWRARAGAGSRPTTVTMKRST